MERHLKNVSTLQLDVDKCTGCKMCGIVCPHNVFVFENKKARIADLDGCMECSACAMNCSVEALSVRRGVGCAAAIISGALGITKGSECCG